MTGFSTVNESELGKFLSKLDGIFVELEKTFSNEFQNKRSDKLAAVDQLNHLKALVKNIKHMASYFDQGKKPGFWDLISFSAIKKNIESSLVYFYTPEKKFFIYLEANLLKLVNVLALPEGSSIEECKAICKRRIEENLSQASPPFDIKQITNILQILNNLDFQPFLNKTMDSGVIATKILEKYRKKFLKNFFDEYQLDINHPIMINFLEKIDSELPANTVTIDKFLSFLDPNAVSVPGYITPIKGRKFCYQLVNSKEINLETIFQTFIQEMPKYIKIWKAKRNNEELQPQQNDRQTKHNERQIREKIREHFRLQFHTYFTETRSIYEFKDLFMNHDYTERVKFFEKVKAALSIFVETEKKDDLIELLNDNHFPGQNFQTLLNRLNLALTNYKKEFRQDININETLNKIRENNKELAKNFDNLYLKIENMRLHGENIHSPDNEHGQIAIQLAKELKQRVNLFIFENQEDFKNKPNKKLDIIKFTHFQRDFKTHLHSQDDHMNRHRAVWKPIVLNILLALGSFFIVPAIKLAMTKLGEDKRATFFCHNTTRMGKVNETHAELDKLMLLIM